MAAVQAAPANVQAEVESFSDIEPQLKKFLYDQNNPPIVKNTFEALEKNLNVPREKVCPPSGFFLTRRLVADLLRVLRRSGALPRHRLVRGVPLQPDRLRLPRLRVREGDPHRDQGRRHHVADILDGELYA